MPKDSDSVQNNSGHIALSGRGSNHLYDSVIYLKRWGSWGRGPRSKPRGSHKGRQLPLCRRLPREKALENHAYSSCSLILRLHGLHCQVPLSMSFLGKNTGVARPFPAPGSSQPRTEPAFLASPAFTTRATWKGFGFSI